MAKKKRRHSPITHETHKRKHREVRDVYNKLRKRYKLEVVYEFFRTNYWLQPMGVDYIINRVDGEAVEPDKSSITYKTVMKEDFYIL